MKKRRLLGIVISLCMALMFVPQMVFAEDITPTIPPKDTDGVYQIGTEAELYGFAELVNGGNTDQNTKAVLTADIIVNKGVLKADGTLADDTSGFTSWTPIGNNSNRYTGKFDGQGHTISGLYFNDASTNCVGLFGYLYSGGEIKNVGVIDSYFVGWGQVGGVCGLNERGAITGCYNTGSVSGSDINVGGVCGLNERGAITGCYNTGTVSGTGNQVGGVCGQNYSSEIIGCYNTGTVNCNRRVGGVCGQNEIGKITGCYNTGSVNGSGSNVGGVCGYNAGPITGCYINNGGVYGENVNIVTDCDVKSDEEFANSTVCKLLDTALQNASSDVRFCQRIGKDASPLLTYQFDSIDDHTDDNPKDHICDICGERLSDHTGIDENPKDHLCDICAETLSNHTGGEATCTRKAICEYCKNEYGDLLDHDLENIPSKDATVNEEGNIEYWKCLDCGRLFADENGEKEISLEDTVIKKLTPETDGDKDQSTKADAEDSVKTGDDTNLVLWLALMLLSGAGITGVTAFARRKRTNE